jgi:hypothetical protein
MAADERLLERVHAALGRLVTARAQGQGTE